MKTIGREALLTACSVAFLAAYVIPILWLHEPSGAHATCTAVTIATWLVFAADYLHRLLKAPRRLSFMRANLLDLIVLVVPFARSVRVLRLISLLHLLNRSASTTFRGQVVRYIIGSTGLIVFVSAVAILDAERSAPGANIVSFGDALWWSITTVSTVGYGDRFPVTGSGRLIAACLMIAGIALLGTVTASLASWLLERVKEAETASDGATADELRHLREEMAALRVQLAQSHPGEETKR